MFGFIIRALQIAFWIGAICVGMVIVWNGVWQVYMAREMPHNLFGDAGGFRTSLWIMAGLSLVGGTTSIVFSAYRIYRSLTQPLPPITHMRAPTPDKQIFYALAFSLAVVLSGSTLLMRGPTFVRGLSAYALAQDATAKIIKIENPASIPTPRHGLYKLENADKPSAVTATYIYYTQRNQPITTSGKLPSYLTRSRPHPGDTFDVTYNPRHPAKHHLGARPSGLYMAPAVLEILLLVFMLAGGIIGVRQNLDWE